MKKVLMLCLGNICRSPTAEAILRKMVEDKKLEIYVDSAGTAGYHIGERSDSRSIKHAESRGYRMTHLARQLTISDFKEFDHILVKDASNYENALRICPDEAYREKVKMVSEFDPSGKIREIPDPYYGEARDFEVVLDYLEICLEGYLRTFKGRI